VVCAVLDGRGWSERPGALADVVIATGGRTYTLATLDQMLASGSCGPTRDGPAVNFAGGR
jgi:hypothetical protein